MAEDSSDCSLNDEDLANISLGSDSDDSLDEDVKKIVLLGKIDYKAQKATQVSFKKGSRIIVLGKPDGGWFRGRLESNYEEGLFPVNYCVSEEEWEALKAAAQEQEVIMVCKCLEDYVAKTPTELSFKCHDRIEVLDNSDPHVWRAKAKGKVGTVQAKMLEEDKGFTIRRAAAQKQASRDRFAHRRKKEATNISVKSASQGKDMDHLKKEQEKLQAERESLQKTKEERKEQRLRRDQGSFNDRLKARSDQKKLEAAAKRAEEEKIEKAKKVEGAVNAWLGDEE